MRDKGTGYPEVEYKPSVGKCRDLAIGPLLGRLWSRNDWWIRWGSHGWGLSYRRYDFTTETPPFSERYGKSWVLFWGRYQAMRSLRILRPLKNDEKGLR